MKPLFKINLPKNFIIQVYSLETSKQRKQAVADLKVNLVYHDIQNSKSVQIKSKVLISIPKWKKIVQLVTVQTIDTSTISGMLQKLGLNRK